MLAGAPVTSLARSAGAAVQAPALWSDADAEARALAADVCVVVGPVLRALARPIVLFFDAEREQVGPLPWARDISSRSIL